MLSDSVLEIFVLIYRAQAFIEMEHQLMDSSVVTSVEMLAQLVQ